MIGHRPNAMIDVSAWCGHRSPALTFEDTAIYLSGRRAKSSRASTNRPDPAGGTP
jgi:hypothetical protein